MVSNNQCDFLYMLITYFFKNSLSIFKFFFPGLGIEVFTFLKTMLSVVREEVTVNVRCG